MNKVTRLIGRAEETAKLNSMLASGNAGFLAVYGRRWVGKTFLIRQHLKDNIVFDFTGTREGTKEGQLKNFFEEYLKRTKGKKEKQPPLTWQDAFRYLVNYLNTLPKKTETCCIY